MPPRKPSKETVVYPASKRKAPPFKPQRPSKFTRTPTNESESSGRKGDHSSLNDRRVSGTSNTAIGIEDVGAEETGVRSTGGSDKSDSEGDLDENPLAARRRPAKAAKQATAKRKVSRQALPISSPPQSSHLSPQRTAGPAFSNPPVALSQSEDNTTIPQPLLVRLLHEQFDDKKTKIDKHAIQVLQKYFEIFVHEAIARAQLQKKEDAETAGKTGEVDVNWLELQDLDKVAAGMLLEF